VPNRHSLFLITDPHLIFTQMDMHGTASLCKVLELYADLPWWGRRPRTCAWRHLVQPAGSIRKAMADGTPSFLGCGFLAFFWVEARLTVEQGEAQHPRVGLSL
jgi:hypothetical protein